MGRLHRYTPARGWARFLVSLALFFVQGTVAFTPITEARQGIGAASHVESADKGVHYAHNDANCAYCVARTFHSPPATPVELPKVLRSSRSVPHTRSQRAPVRLTSHSQHSRAPPSLSL